RYVVGKMLTKGPDSRYQLVREARRDLQELARSLPEKPPTRVPQIQYPLGLLILFSMVVLVGWVFFSPLFTSSPTPLAEGTTILVTDLDNQTKDASLGAVSEMLRNQLQQSAYFEVAEPARIREVLDRMVRPSEQLLDLETAREVAWREGIPLILRSSLSRLGSNYLLAMDLEEIAEDPRFRERGWGRTFTSESKDGIFDAVDSASQWVREMIGETAQDLSLSHVPVREATTSSWRALELYSKAETLTQQDRHSDAILLLEEAIRIDPDFALATMRMGDILISLGRYREGYQFWRKAQETTQLRRLTKREEHRIKAMYSLDTGDFAAAETRFKIFSIHYPNDYYPVFFQAFALRALGREEEAIQKFREAREKRPAFYYISVQLAKTYLLTGDFQAVRDEVTTLRRLGQDEWAGFLEGAAAFLEGDELKAQERFERLLVSPDPFWRSSAASFLANILGERGAYRDAITLLTEMVKVDREHPEMFARRADKLLALGYLWYRLGNFDRCKEFCLEAIEADASPQRLQRAGALLARSGFIREAEGLLSYLNAYPSVPVAVVARSRIMGEVLLARGRDQDAVALLKQAEALEPSYAPRDYLARALARLEDYTGALEIYDEILNSPGRFWLFPNEEFPGLRADCVFDYSQLALSAGEYCEALDSTRTYLSLRRIADEEVTEVKQAHAILADLEKQEPCHTTGDTTQGGKYEQRSSDSRKGGHITVFNHFRRLPAGAGRSE
ncbi:MAG TPA: tetratricopeptide repeat protein, partial [Acidobacteriota bacterium]|nr:tetratricopeptide repeat protein [Acidobacteriota bacterium]